MHSFSENFIASGLLRAFKFTKNLHTLCSARINIFYKWVFLYFKNININKLSCDVVQLQLSANRCTSTDDNWQLQSTLAIGRKIDTENNRNGGSNNEAITGRSMIANAAVFAFALAVTMSKVRTVHEYFSEWFWLMIGRMWAMTEKTNTKSIQ